ncbi:Retrovirus-related Pol polyprotein from transposon TNT 1-94 [Araneus ventricosus]|uniref:Retrovirus-related Pol polyprotein from transposon TNT 1-94 n=1 Tax=Araneus ventricosus TaxID=182803 RepID=A0A4Y2V589_ARAVE|nr:Retrovirus-related Pol polyprotein from transposon TNT 1-94 [Araneus ventricosus]
MSDNGEEFINTEFDNFLKTNGIKRRLTVPYCPEQSGIAERKNRSLVEMARCLLSQAKLPLNMWAEAVNTANYLSNRYPTKALSGKTPYELFNEIVPNVSYFKTFGCTAYCLDNKPSHKFSARSKKGIFVGLTLIMVYVDDILFTSHEPSMLQKFKIHLKKDLEIKYAYLAKYCLGLNFQQQNGIVAMSQQSYIRELLNRFDMTEAKTVVCPMDLNIRLKRSDECDTEGVPYRELVGGLLYLATSTRPDIANTVSKLSQFLNYYDNTHWKAAKRVLRYLKKTINFGLIFKHTDEPLFGYTDSDWANFFDDRKSYTGFCFILSGSAISWESRKQCTVALSSTEAEYMALSDGTKEAIYLRKLLNELCGADLKSVRG